MTVVKVSLVRSFALLYKVALKVTRILHKDIVGVNGESKGCHFNLYRKKVQNPFLFV